MRGRCPLNKPIRLGKPLARAGMSESHLANIRQCCCLICGKEGPRVVDPHHLLRTGEHGLNRKSSDRWAVPLCADLNEGHHLGRNGPHAHGDEDAWFAEHGLDGRAIARMLWMKRGDLEAMQRIAAAQAQKVRTGI